MLKGEKYTESEGSAQKLGFEPLSDASPLEPNMHKQAWPRLHAKVYKVDPLVCPKCGSDMKIITVIQDPDEIKKILTHLAKIGR